VLLPILGRLFIVRAMERPAVRQTLLQRTTLIMAFLASFLGGLAAARSGYIIDGSWTILSLIFVLVALNRQKATLLFALILLGVTAGWWRSSVYSQKSAIYNQLYETNVVIIGQAESDGIYDERSQLSFDLGSLRLQKGGPIELVGKIGVAGFGEAAVYRGDIVQVEGKLFPGRGSRQAYISFAQLEVVGRERSIIETLRLKFLAGMQNALPEPQASFGLGLLVGQRDTLPDDIAEKLSIVGLTHIIAVSGYNLTIIMRSMRRILGKRSKYQATVLSVSLVVTFLLFTGFSPSIVRAAVVSLLSLVAWYYGRTIKPLLILLLAAALTAGWNPLYLWSDIGWYLSFLAFFGILIIAPLVIKRLYKNKKPRGYMYIFIESVSAQIMAAPLIMYIFGEVSLIALVANLLIVPLVPLAMLLSLAAGIGGMLVPVLAGWLAWPARFLLTYMIDIAVLLSRIPHALKTVSLSLLAMLAIYVMILVVVVTLWHKTRGQRGIITDETQLV